MFREFEQALREARDDDEVKVVIIKGAGRCFSAGFDLEHIPESWYARRGEPPRNQRDKIIWNTEYCQDWLLHLFTFPKLTIAQVHGFVIGEGLIAMELRDNAVGPCSKKQKSRRIGGSLSQAMPHSADLAKQRFGSGML